MIEYSSKHGIIVFHPKERMKELNSPIMNKEKSTVADVARHAYLHVPFCLRKCSYCAFVSEKVGQGDLIEPYVDALRKQIVLQRSLADPLNQSLRTVYFGGGTPTCIPTADLVSLLALIRENYGISEEAEVTLEMNPGTLDSQDLQALREAGFNRLSLGAQTLDNELLKRLGRFHNVEDIWMAMELAQHSGFTNLNVDLMLGLPGQTIDDVLGAIRAVVDAGATHLSFYSLILEEDTPLARRVMQGIIALPDEDEERNQYHAAFELLDKIGVPPYEISCAARPGYYSKHNISYWEGRSYYGWGTSASSFIRRTRRTMTRSTDEYISLFGQTGEDSDLWMGTAEEEHIDDEEAMQEYLIFGLRRLSGVSDREAKTLLGRSIPAKQRAILDKHVVDGLLEKKNDSTWAYTKRGLDLADAVARDLI